MLWHSKIPVPGAQKVMNSLPGFNKKRFFFTNNSTLTRKQFVQKFKSLGFDAAEVCNKTIVIGVVKFIMVIMMI